MGVKQVYADPAERTLLEFQMTRRVAHFMLEALLAVIALVVVLVGVFAWRLSSGPISVDFLNPMMEEEDGAATTWNALFNTKRH